MIIAEKVKPSSLHFYSHDDTKISNTTQDERHSWRAYHMNRKKGQGRKSCSVRRGVQIPNTEQSFRIGPDEHGMAANQLRIQKESCHTEKKHWKEMGKGGKCAFHHCILMDRAFKFRGFSLQ